MKKREKKTVLKQHGTVYYETLEELMGILKKADDSGKQREELIAGVHHILKNLKNDPEEKKDVLYLMLDLISTYSDDIHQIQYAAMIYDMVCKLQGKDPDYDSVYDDETKENIVAYALERMICVRDDSDANLKEWLEDISYSLELDFVYIFCQKLIERIEVKAEKRRERQKKRKHRVFRKKLQLTLVIATVVCVLGIAFASGMLVGKSGYLKEQNVQENSVTADEN